MREFQAKGIEIKHRLSGNCYSATICNSSVPHVQFYNIYPNYIYNVLRMPCFSACQCVTIYCAGVRMQIRRTIVTVAHQNATTMSRSRCLPAVISVTMIVKSLVAIIIEQRHANNCYALIFAPRLLISESRSRLPNFREQKTTERRIIDFPIFEQRIERNYQ